MKDSPRFVSLAVVFCFPVTFCLAIGLTDSSASEPKPGNPPVSETAASSIPGFNQEIRPILSDACFACHGPDEHGRQAGLRLDDREEAVDAGAIEPGDAMASLIIERILETDPDLVMPPPETGKKLSADDIEMLRRWINGGATYQKHWSFEPIPETIATPDTGKLTWWPETKLDTFIAAELDRRDWSPAPPVTREGWLRRVCFDLTGLPPSPQQLDQFLADPSPGAKARVVDRLLADPAYGQRMANMWLDVARYADTFGYQADVPMDVWPWRDWVIEAFNANLPYDEFVTWQIAGDQLDHASVDQRLATTFNRLHRQTNEGGSIPEEFRIANIVDRTSTFSTAFLGLTFECARCHDHKYDPILQKDFYSLSAYFSNIDELGVYSHFTHSPPTPTMSLYEGDQQAEHQAALRVVADAREKLDACREELIASLNADSAAWLNDLPEVPAADCTHPLDGDLPGIVDTATRCTGDDSITVPDAPLFGRNDPLTLSIWVRPATTQPRMMVLHQSVAAEDSGFRGLQWTIDDGFPEFSLIHFWPGDALRVQSQIAIPQDTWTHLAVSYDGGGRAAGVRLFVNGVAAPVDVQRDQLTRDIRHRSDWGDMKVGQVKMELAARFRDIGFRDGGLDALRIYKRRLSDAEIAAIYAHEGVDSPPPAMTDAMRVQHAWIHDTDSVAPARDAWLDALRHENEVFARVRQIMTMREAVVPRDSHILLRGEYDNRGPKVVPATPSFLPQISESKNSVARLSESKNTVARLSESKKNASESRATLKNASESRATLQNGSESRATLGNRSEGQRLQLARWLSDPANPLPARVMANRLWHHFFGRGIVVSLEDFGSQGTPPTHPALLDHLSRSLIHHDWDLKHLIRQIVLSKAYGQSSRPSDPQRFVDDPNNQWLARGPKHRLSAEQVRDAALAASGLLVRTIGGPSVKPYQPAGLWKESGTGKKYVPSSGAGLYRRSLYTFWKRTSPPPSMITFDATSRESCTARRELTTTPLQALILLNDPQYVEASRTLAEQLIRSHDDDLAARWNELFRRLISRSMTSREAAIVTTLYREQKQYFEQEPAAAHEFLKVGQRPSDASLDAVDLAATSVVVKTIFNYDETMMKR